MDEELLLLKKYYHCTLYLENKKKLEKISIDLETTSKDLKRNKKSKNQQDKKIREFVEDLRRHKVAMDTLFYGARKDLEKAKIRTKDDHLALWKENNIQDLLEDPERRLLFFQGINQFYDKVTDRISEASDNKGLDEANMLSELIELLEHYITTDIIIPGANTTVNVFVELLKKQRSKHETLVAENNFYTVLINNLNDLKAAAKRYFEHFIPDIQKYQQKLSSNGGETRDSLGEYLNKLEEDKKRISSNLSFHKESCIKLDVKQSEIHEELQSLQREDLVKPYLLYDERMLSDKISSSKTETKVLKEKIKINEKNLQRLEMEVVRLEKQEPHKYQDYQDQLNTIFAATQKLQQKIAGEYEENIKNLINKNIDNKKLTKNQKYYFENVAVYLAKKVDTFKHIERNYKAEKLDLIEEQIFTKSGKVINLRDFGTGQGQSMYLNTLLNKNRDQKLIALIDEVAMMDSSSMKSIYTTLKDQYEKGQLLAGVVVQRSEKLKVTPIVG